MDQNSQQKCSKSSLWRQFSHWRPRAIWSFWLSPVAGKQPCTAWWVIALIRCKGTVHCNRLMRTEWGPWCGVLRAEKLLQSRWESTLQTTIYESTWGPKIASHNERWACLPQPPAQAELQMLFSFPTILSGLSPEERTLFQTSQASVNGKLKPQKLLLLCKLGSKTQSLGFVPGSRSNG